MRALTVAFDDAGPWIEWIEWSEPEPFRERGETSASCTVNGYDSTVAQIRR